MALTEITNGFSDKCQIWDVPFVGFIKERAIMEASSVQTLNSIDFGEIIYICQSADRVT